MDDAVVDPNKRNALASLMDDAVVEILRRLPAHSLFYCKCVCRSWNSLISDNYKLMPQTMAWFFYDGFYGQQNFIPTCYNQFLKRGILAEINGRPYYLPYVSLLSELESLAEE